MSGFGGRRRRRNPTISTFTNQGRIQEETRKRHSNKTRRKIWIATFYAILWSLWMHRNEIIFKNCELDLQTVSHLIKWRVATWSKAWEEKVPYSAEMMAHNFQAIPMLFR
uniref:Uncharacterized protein n=1 Tax=Opuntia streptacantha TaxID=393608 RepID=A0A7C9CLK4_OPUST